MKLPIEEMHSSGGYPAAAVDMTVTVQTASAIIGKSPSVSMINHSWFSSLKRPLKKKFGKSHNNKEKPSAEYANHHQHYSSLNNSKSKSVWDIPVSDGLIHRFLYTCTYIHILQSRYYLWVCMCMRVYFFLYIFFIFMNFYDM